MAQKLLTMTWITYESLRVLHNICGFTRGSNREYNKEFSVGGAKIGSVCNVRLPNRYYTVEQTALLAQDTSEQTVPVTLTTPWQTSLNFSEIDLLLSADDFSKRFILPAMCSIAAKIDVRGMQQSLNIYNQVGTPGTIPGTSGGSATGLAQYNSPAIFLMAGALMDKFSVPRDGRRSCYLEPFAQANSVNGLSGLLNPSQYLGENFRTGTLGNALGYEFFSTPNTTILTTGNRAGTPLVNGAGQTGSNLVTNGWTAGTTINQGEIFTIAGVQSVNPENQQTNGVSANFVVTATTTADSNGNMTIPIAPAIIVANTNPANGPLTAYGTVTASPAMGAALTLASGSANTSYITSIANHQDAFTLATADLMIPGGVDYAARENYEGISMAIVRAFDINTRNMPTRVDVLGGWATLRAELACRLTS